MQAVVGGMPATAPRIMRTMLVLVCAMGLLAATSGQALAKKHKPKKPTITTHTPVTKGSTYLALGDSVTFGYEEAQVVPAPNRFDASSFLGYPELLGSELHLKVVNASCPGETSSSLIDATAQSNGCENTAVPGGQIYRAMWPLHVSYSESQLAFAVGYLKKHHNVRLVSVMIGANDFFVCQETTADHCASLTEQAAVVATVGNSVKATLSQIRNKAHYRDQLAIVNYYSLDYSSTAQITSTKLLNATVDNAAEPFHVEVADEFGELEAGAQAGGAALAG